MLIIYYLIILFTAILAWPYSYGTKGQSRFAWIVLGVLIITFPMWLSLKVAIYYGLIGNTTIFLWSADTYMGKENKRKRVFIAWIILIPLPLIWPPIIQNLWGVFLVPTFGYFIAFGIVVFLYKSIVGLFKGISIGIRRNK